MIMPKSIKVNSELTSDTVFETLKKDGNIPIEAYLHKGVIGGNLIYFPGENNRDIQVYAKKGKLTVGEAPRPKNVIKSYGKELVLDSLTNNWFSILRDASNKNEVLFDLILAECKRLFEV